MLLGVRQSEPPQTARYKSPLGIIDTQKGDSQVFTMIRTIEQTHSSLEELTNKKFLNSPTATEIGPIGLYNETDRIEQEESEGFSSDS